MIEQPIEKFKKRLYEVSLERYCLSIAIDMYTASQHIMSAIENNCACDSMELREAFKLVTLAAAPILSEECLKTAQAYFPNFEDD